MLKHDHNRPARAERRLAIDRRSRDTGAMAKTLDHLPGGKQRELDFVVEILTEEFRREISTLASPHLNRAKILKIILFGSYARGDWVEDPVGRYFSDYDLLIVVEKDKFTDILEFWEGAETRLLDELSLGQRLRTPVNFIVHSLEGVNEQLSRGRYFFADIFKEGILLSELPGYPFVELSPISQEDALAEAEEYFEAWISSSDSFLPGVQTRIDRSRFQKSGV